MTTNTDIACMWDIYFERIRILDSTSFTTNYILARNKTQTGHIGLSKPKPIQ